MSKTSDEELTTMLAEVGGNIAEMARRVGLGERQVRRRMATIRARQAEFDSPQLPLEDIPIEDIIELRKKRFERKARHEEIRKLIPVKIKLDGPIGLLHFGDPHVDDDGTDIALLEEHMRICRNTVGLFGANIGDITNNWVGRIAHLYSDQSTSAKEAWRIAEWFLMSVPWLYVIGGNHDAWSGAGDPLQWILAQSAARYEPSEVRLELRFPNKRKVRVNARHDFKGHSIYNPAHGVMKSLHFGIRDHIAICGHKHVSGYGVLKCPDTNIVMHGIQLASYKIYDRFARERGFRDQNISPAVVTIIDPNANEVGLVQVFWNVEEAAEYLTWKRKSKR